jgi:cytochrome c oxidase assembly factor CtaG
MTPHAIALSRFAGEWSLQVGPLALAAAALALFLHGFVRLRRRGRADHASCGRLVAFTAGVVLSVVPLVSPIDPLGDGYLLSAHMLEHVLLADAGPALMVFAVRGPLVMFLLPPALLRPLARSRAVRRPLRVVMRPAVGLAAWATVIGLWHVPAAYDYTLRHERVHDLEHAMFAIVGLLVWTQLIDPARHGHLRLAHRLIFALALFGLGQVLADVLLLTFTPLYAAYAHQPARVGGISPLLDQRLAGAVMMVEQAVTLGTFSVLTYRRRAPGALGSPQRCAEGAGEKPVNDAPARR